MKENNNNNLKELVLKNGKIVVEDKEKDLRVRKNYSLPAQTINDIEELAKTLNCSASEAIVEAIKIVNSMLDTSTKRRNNKNNKNNTNNRTNTSQKENKGE